ncbi:hypothetical protein O3M35_011437 [Rhynocoris fuscipes]|uniref:Odorant receptor n=1 Tax=Rhynocoris fuscipes TaxID=488301 RepID=A0AAW1CV54_9HEMI
MVLKDDKEVEKFLVDEYVYLHRFGLFYAPWDNYKRYLSALQYIVYYTIMSYMLMSFLITAYLCIDDIAIFSQSIHIAICGVVAWTISITGLCSRNDFIMIHSTIIRDYKEFENGKILKGLRRKMEKQKKCLLIFWTCYYGFCAIIAVTIAPMVDTYLGVNPHVNVQRGVYMKLPLALWSPIDVENSTTAYIIVSLIMAGFLAISALMVSSGVIGCVFVQQHICLQLRLLIYSIKNIEDKTVAEYNKRYLNTRKEDLYNDEKYWKCYEFCFKQNIRHHQTIIKHHKLFKNFASIPLSVPIFSGAILLAMAGIHILSDDLRVGPKLLSFFLVFGEMLNMLMLCVCGEELKQLGEDVRLAAYSIKWYDSYSQNKKFVTIMSYGALMPLVLKAGNLVELNMPTFATIMNSAYSYFNLIYAIK